MKQVEVNGANFTYIEKGQGDPVILAHGTLGDYRSWELQMDHFAKKYHTISYSRRYHYPNFCNGDETDYSASLHADDLSHFISALGFHSAHIVGNSYGAYTALHLALRDPEKIKTLVLSEPPVLPFLDNNKEGTALRKDFLAHVWEPAGEALRRGEIEEGVRIFVDGVVTKGAFESFPEEVKGLILDNSCEFRAETSSPNFWTAVSREDVEKITTPVLLLTGEVSLKMLKLVVDELNEYLPNKELVTIPSSSHETASENPEAYNRTVLDFLAEHSR